MHTDNVHHYHNFSPHQLDWIESMWHQSIIFSIHFPNTHWLDFPFEIDNRQSRLRWYNFKNARFCTSKMSEVKTWWCTVTMFCCFFPGILPFARELLSKGTQVILTANSIPSINDITAKELEEIVSRASKIDTIFQRAFLEETLKIVPSGNDLPVIDLRKVG